MLRGRLQTEALRSPARHRAEGTAAPTKTASAPYACFLVRVWPVLPTVKDWARSPLALFCTLALC